MNYSGKTKFLEEMQENRVIILSFSKQDPKPRTHKEILTKLAS